MTRRVRVLAWAAAACTYFLIVLGALVRITGSGLGCGEHWPRCFGRWFPPLNDIGTLIEWNHRLAAALVTILVVAVAASAWWESRDAGWGMGDGADRSTARSLDRLPYIALALLLIQVTLGAIVVKLALPPWTVILHLGTAMLLLATLLIIATEAGSALRFTPGLRPGLVILALGFVTVLFGALTANLGAASACLGFPLCNGQVIPAGNYLQAVHWIHRLLGFGLLAGLAWWAWRTPRAQRGAAIAALLLAAAQVAIAAAMVLLALPRGLQVAHAAVGTALWAALVLAARGER